MHEARDRGAERQTMTKYTELSDLLADLAGARRDVLEVVPGARTKFVAVGAVVVATAGLAALSAAFAAGMALKAPLVVAIAIGLVWGVVILTIDRALVVGMNGQRTLGRSALMALPRLVLALILGTVISTPITLQIFHPEIDTEIRAMHQQAADQFRTDLAADTRFAPIPQLEQQVADAKARQISGGTSDSVVKAKQDAYDAAYAEYLRLQEQAQCELNGRCGTGREGVGEAYRNVQAAADRQRTIADAARQERDAAAAASAGQAESDLATAQKQLDSLTQQRDQLQGEFDARNADNTGLLIRLEALHRIGERDSMLGWAHLLLWAMFTCIELLPVLIKLLMHNGAVSAYDRVLTAQDDGEADVFEGQLQSWKDLQRERSQAGLDIERDRIDRERRQGVSINERVFEVQSKVVGDAITIWSRHAKARTHDQLDELERQMAAPRPSRPRRNGTPTNHYVLNAQLPDGTAL